MRYSFESGSILPHFFFLLCTIWFFLCVCYTSSWVVKFYLSPRCSSFSVFFYSMHLICHLAKCLPILLRAISISEFIGPSMSLLNTSLSLSFLLALSSYSVAPHPSCCCKYWQLTHYGSLYADLFNFTIVAVVTQTVIDSREIAPKSDKIINENTTQFAAKAPPEYAQSWIVETQ